MNYLTNYYKNLSEQLQEKIIYLQNLIEQQSTKDTPYPNYNYEKHKTANAWEYDDISPDAMDDVSAKLGNQLTTNDFFDSSDDGRTVKPRVYYTAKSLQPWFKNEDGRPVHEPVEYNKKEDAPGVLDALSGVGKQKNRNIELANARAVLDKEIKTNTGNWDITSTATLRHANDPLGKFGTNPREVVWNLLRDAEKNVRTKKGIPVE